MKTTPEIVVMAKKIAMTNMTGTRKGNPRPAWAHPEDVVGLVQSLPGLRPDMETQCFLEAVAWLHDILEDTKITEVELKAAGIPDHVIMGVKALTKEEWMTREWYFRGLDGMPELVRIVKVCDRIANLTEGKGVLGASWWKRYTHETAHFIVPLTDDMGEPWRSWLLNKLAEVTA